MKNNASLSRFIVLTGNYGSGKTEIALNLALLFAGKKERVALVDLDIVNPYFRSAEQKSFLEKAGVRVLMPVFAMTTVDIPALPAEIQSVFEEKWDHVIFDVGGDDTGAAALGQYFPAFQHHRKETTMVLVINCMRPLTGTEDDILDLAARIETRGRLKIDMIVNNTNLANQTEPDMVMQGEKTVCECARLLNASRVITSGKKEVLDACSLHTERFEIERRMVPEWMED